MRRPIVFAAAAFAGGIEAAYLGGNLFVLPALAGAVTLVSGGGRPVAKRAAAYILLGLFLAGGFLLLQKTAGLDFPADFAGERALVWGEVESVQKKAGGQYRLVIKVRSLERENGERYFGEGLVLATVYGKEADGSGALCEGYGDLAGRAVCIRGELALAQPRRNPKTFDYRFYLRSCGIDTVLTADAGAIETGAVTAPLRNGLSRLKQRFTERLYAVMPKESAALAAGMLFGDKSGMEDEFYERFQKNGTAHVLAVSGLHVGLVYMCIQKLFGGRQSPVFSFLALALLVCYAMLADFSPSAVRAVSMIALHIFSKLARCRYDMLSAAAATALAALLRNPLALFHPGFQLSYLAIVSLAVLLPALSAPLGKAAGALGPILAIQAGMAPVTAQMFNYVSVGAFFANVPILILAGAAVPLGMLLVPLCLLPACAGGELLYGMAAAALEVICRLLVSCNDWIYAGGAGTFTVRSPGVFWLCVYYGCLFTFGSEYGRILLLRGQKRRVAVLLAAVALLGAGGQALSADGFERARIVFVDVGQGDAIHIRTPEGKNLLIDGGGSVDYDVGKKILLPYFLKNGVKAIDLALVTHRHADHYGGLVSLAREMEVKRLGLYEANQVLEEEILAETGLKPENLLYLRAGQTIALGNETEISILYPPEKSREEYLRLTDDSADENSSSLTIKVSCGGVSLLTTGDMDAEGERALLARLRDTGLLRVDLLKAGHHGSRYSTGDRFLREVSPAAVVFQVGKNTFGHPHPSILEKCRDAGLPVYRNDLQGAIGVFAGKGGRVMIRGFLD